MKTMARCGVMDHLVKLWTDLLEVAKTHTENCTATETRSCFLCREENARHREAVSKTNEAITTGLIGPAGVIALEMYQRRYMAPSIPEEKN